MADTTETDWEKAYDLIRENTFGWPESEGVEELTDDQERHVEAIARALAAAREQAPDNRPISTVPCSTCAGPCREFVVESDVWNKVVRRGGPEHDKEYLCVDCWNRQVEAYIREQATPPKGHVRTDDGKVRKVYEWSVNPLTERIHAEIDARPTP